ncbi:hypothetical protein [Cryobacterium sp. Y29]|uniref:hypothetical protein n=1 Tax=Cryobacterium sp. Y29 TaxID=2048285 RepID=UPI000CE408AF|nr:hypothetical protein [Cryobacterium sp. Y29]
MAQIEDDDRSAEEPALPAPRQDHLIEQRFMYQMGGTVNDWPTLVLTRNEHTASANAWREAIPLASGTLDVTKGQIKDAARSIYADHAEILNELGPG